MRGKILCIAATCLLVAPWATSADMNVIGTIEAKINGESKTWHVLRPDDEAGNGAIWMTMKDGFGATIKLKSAKVEDETLTVSGTFSGTLPFKSLTGDTAADAPGHHPAGKRDL